LTDFWNSGLKDWFNQLGQLGADVYMALVPRRRPDIATVRQCKIVAHRGAHGYNKLARENTLEAFELARLAGIWSIEADVRWTADLVPVISHDPDTQRVFGEMVAISEVTFDELRCVVPGLPSLAELVERFGGNTHLMLELKEEVFPDIERQKQILREHLSELRPNEDYHILTLDPDLFEGFDIMPRNCCLAVAFDNMAVISKKTLQSPYGGIAGHYLLLTDNIKRRHEKVGQKVGTGFIRSRNCLFREMNRNVEWIFSNDAVSLQQIVDKLGKQ
jgi:glycerophosphoryl diester phosphodiesterase